MDCKWQNIAVNLVTQSFPSVALSLVEKPPLCSTSSVVPLRGSVDPPPNDGSSLSDVHISEQLMGDFLELARRNTEKDLETCGVLAAVREKGTFYVTTLIVPKQESTANSCEAMKEEEFFAIQTEGSLLPTHPTQKCFMSSVDLHTQYTYQRMVPEAFAIVMAPTDTTRNFGIFRISDPRGMEVLSRCEGKGFHPHEEEGNPIYHHCSNVYMNPNLRFEIYDLR